MSAYLQNITSHLLEGDLQGDVAWLRRAPFFTEPWKIISPPSDFRLIRLPTDLPQRVARKISLNFIKHIRISLACENEEKFTFLFFASRFCLILRLINKIINSFNDWLFFIETERENLSLTVAIYQPRCKEDVHGNTSVSLSRYTCF